MVGVTAYRVEQEWELAISEAVRRADLDERARRDALRDIAKDIPDPEVYARYIPSHLATLLLAAMRSNSGFKVLPSSASELRPYGLCDYASTELTAFGMAVRRALKAQEL